MICSCRTYAALFCIYCVFDVISFYKPDDFLRSPRHIFIQCYFCIRLLNVIANRGEESSPLRAEASRHASRFPAEVVLARALRVLLNHLSLSVKRLLAVQTCLSWRIDRLSDRSTHGHKVKYSVQ